MKEIYLLSGLGADRRVFDSLNLSDYKVSHINWIEPRKDESIEDYAFRISKQIISERPLLIGVSFGGMIAVEVGKHIKTDKIILISSAQTRKDLPFIYRFIGLINLSRMVPTSLLKSVNFLTYWFFGINHQTEKNLLKSIIKDTDDYFLRWSIDKIVNWSNEVEMENIISIHGTADRILPIRKADDKIQGGGHFMIVNKALEISDILRERI